MASDPHEWNDQKERDLRSFVHSWDATQSAKDFIQSIEGDRAISWGWSALDDILGKMVPGRWHVIGARPGNGKTTFLLNMMDNLTLGNRKVAYFGTEVSPEVLMLMWAAYREGLNIDEVVAGRWDNLPEGSRDAVLFQLDKIGMEGKAWIPECIHPSINDLHDLVTYAKGLDVEVILFDHLHRLRTGRDEREAIAKACVFLKTMAQQHGIIVITAAHLGRGDGGVFDKYRPPHMSSFFMSSAIEANADVALGMYRQMRPLSPAQHNAVKHGYLDISEFIVPDCMSLKVLKHRFGGHKANDRVIHLNCRNGYVTDWVGGL